MSILKQLLAEMTQGEMEFDESLDKLARDVARELTESAIQMMQEMSEEDPDLEIDESTLLAHVEVLYEEMFMEEVMTHANKHSKKYVDQLNKE